MTSNSMLKDYSDDDKLKRLLDSVDDPRHPSIQTRYYTLYSLLPDLRNNVVLDVPCGLGNKSRKFITESAAKKVIAVEIIQKQIELSKEADVVAGIKPDQIEYALHDAKQPKVLADPLVDICVYVHLLCFAKNYEELIGMCRFIYINLKPGGVCYGLICSLTKDAQLAKRFEEFNAEILHLDPWQGNAAKERRFCYNSNGFRHDVCLWEFDTVCQALKEVGFDCVELHPYQVNPSLENELNLALYTSILDGNIIVAKK